MELAATAERPVTVWLADGMYRIAETVTVPASAGGAAAPAREFVRTRDMTVSGYLSNDWFYQFEPVGGIDAERQEIRLLGPTRYGVGNERLPLHRRFFLANTLCHLDEPGEWYYDYRNGGSTCGPLSCRPRTPR
jgi:hypothetical protein